MDGWRVKYFIPQSDLSGTIKELWPELIQGTETTILAQLNDFISRGVLVVESTLPVLVREEHSEKITVKVGVTLKLKDREYIESLERQLTELRDLVSKLRGGQP